ncbi:MAG: ABC transporter substrate-binding protein [Ktedonobacteraceae bacterium]|nr:ABC transporter substrate-binding protein [Ktedonobacteraceae bacterium]
MTTLHAALVTPLNGPLSLFGRTCATALTLWTKSAAHLPSPWTSIDLDVHDTGSDVGAAIRAALETQPDVLFGPYGSGPMLSAARASERLLWNHGGASSRLARPTFPHVINILSPASIYFKGVLEAVHAFDSTIRSVSLFHSTTGFGRDVATGAAATAAKLQLAIQSTPFESSQALAMASTVPNADVLLVVGNFADEQAVAPLLLARSWRFAAFVGAGVEEVLAPLGELREGLLGPTQWIQTAAIEPDEGPDVDWFVAHYREMEGTDPPYAAAQAFAAGLLYARCLRDAEDSHDAALQATAQKLVCQTLFGTFQLDPTSGLQTGHHVLIVQWQQGQRRVVWPPEQAECSLVFSPLP